MKSLTRITVTLLISICIAAILGAGAFIACYCFSYYQGSYIYENLQELAIEPQSDELLGSPPDDSFTSNPVIDFDSLHTINPDIVGWIYVPDTRINYPIVKRLNDNDYYLSHLFDGTVNKSGSIFLDTRCCLDDQHILIHGHNMGNGSMFRDLELFKNKEFFLAHPYYLIFTPDVTYVVEIFAGSVNRIDSSIWKINFQNMTDYNNWLTTCSERAAVDRPLQISSPTQVISLSTCSYEYSQARWLLQGIPRNANEVSSDIYQELLHSFLSIKSN